MVAGDDEAATKLERAIEEGGNIAAKKITEAYGNSQVTFTGHINPIIIAVSNNGGLNASFDVEKVKEIVSNAINENINSADGSMRNPMNSRSMTSPANNSSSMMS